MCTTIVYNLLIAMIAGVVVVVFAIVAPTFARPDEFHQQLDENEAYMHPHIRTARSVSSYSIDEGEYYARFWNKKAQDTIKDKILQKQNTNVAKNVIFFLGDGMSIPTLKAARIYLGQKNNGSGEETELAFEKFPYAGLSKTYCVNRQVPDSACTATAYLCGIKANEATIGVTAKVELGDCPASLLEENRVTSIAKWSQLKGKRTGIVTTTRVTHASPAGVYAQTAHRDWEGSAPSGCQDIAYQLVHGATGRNFNVILGGGRAQFLPNTVIDEEGSRGSRTDNINLIDDWVKARTFGNTSISLRPVPGKYVWNRTALLREISLLPNPKLQTDLLGLFESSHCQYNLDANRELEPSLEEMTEAAIKVLSSPSNSNGFFLFVEGGRIDHAHHDNLAKKSLDETVEFSKAIQKAYDITNPEETLIVVTSDHAHVMNVNGYPVRGNDILEIAGKGSDGIPYTTLSYGNGPGYRKDVNGTRYDPSKDDTTDKNYRFPALVPLGSETHGGDDVGIFATGPWAHLFSGTIEQNVIPHAMAFASCVGDGITVCDQNLK